MLCNPHPLSFDDMRYLEQLYLCQHITTETFSKWFGPNVPFVVLPVINESVATAKKHYCEIESEN